MTARAPTESDEFLRTLRPIVESLGASLVPERSARTGDLPVDWQGETVAFIRVSELHGALDRLIASIEREFGATLADMARDERVGAVRRLDEQGAFLLRGAVDAVATRMGVSRVTLYSYLNAMSPAASE